MNCNKSGYHHSPDLSAYGVLASTEDLIRSGCLLNLNGSQSDNVPYR